MTRSQLVFKNGIILTITSVGVGIINMLFNAFVARKIGAEAMGVFTLVMSIYTFAMTLAVSGVNLASTRLVAEEMAFGREKEAKKAVRYCVFYALFFSILACILLSTCSEFIATKFLRSELTIKPLKVLAISLPFLAISSVLSGYFSAMQQGIKASSSVIVDSLIRVFACTHLLGLAFASAGIENMLIAITLGYAISETFGCLYRFICYKIRNRQSDFNNNSSLLTSNLVKRMLRISLPMAFSSYIKSALSTTKRTLVPINFQASGMVAAVALSQYGIIQGMILPLLLFPTCFLNAFSQLLVPEISALNALEHKKRIKEVISRIFKTTCIFSIFVAGIFIAYAEPLCRIMFARPDIAPMVRIFAFCVPIIYFDVIVDSLLKGLDKQVAVVNINIHCCKSVLRENPYFYAF